MKLFLVRHGETNLNSHRLIQGRFDAPLNNTGKRQAKLAGQTLKKENIEYDYVISSPLSRALETAYYITKKINFKDSIIINPKLVERNFGRYEMTKIVDSMDKIVKNDFKEAYFEDNSMIRLRVSNFLEDLYSKHPSKNVIIAAHAHVIRTFYIMSNDSKYAYNNFYLKNGSISIFNYEGKDLELIKVLNNNEE